MSLYLIFKIGFTCFVVSSRISFLKAEDTKTGNSSKQLTYLGIAFLFHVFYMIQDVKIIFLSIHSNYFVMQT